MRNNLKIRPRKFMFLPFTLEAPELKETVSQGGEESGERTPPKMETKK